MRVKNNPVIWFPLIIAISIVFGIIIGNHISTKKFILDKDRKINTVLNFIESEYVDTVDIKELVELAIPQLISNLDPHSYYIPAKDVKAVNDDLNGSISGIGITFTMMNDSAHVIEIIPNGPAEKAGLMPGDRIVTVNDSSIVGMTSDKIQSLIRGTKDTKVKLGIKRCTSKKLLPYEITRGDIPVNTVDASYMIDKRTGYIKVNKFGRNGSESAKAMNEAFASDAQILYFPAGLCSRKIKGEITDLPWKNTFLKKAKEYGRDIVPVFFEGRNSAFFYRLARLRKALGIKFNIEMMFLPHEMFRQKGARFDVYFGKPIDISSIDGSKNVNEWVREIRDTAYKLKPTK